MKVKTHVCGINVHVSHKDSLTVTVIGNVDGFFWAAGFVGPELTMFNT